MNTLIYKFSKKMQEKAAEYYNSVDFTVDEDIYAFFDVPYQGSDNNRLYMDIYRPKGRDEEILPAIIMVHGGGLYVGDRKLEIGICQHFARRGYLVFAPEYRLTTDADACQEIGDVCAGFRYIEQVIGAYRGDSSRVYVAAESAGAFLSVYVAAMHKSEVLRKKIGSDVSHLTLRKMACFSGMFYTNKMDIIGTLYPKQIYGHRRFDKDFMQYMDPEHSEVLGNLPPMFLTSSDADFLKRYTLEYDKALTRNGKRHELHFPVGNKALTHAFPALRPELKESVEVVDRVAAFFS